MTDRYKELSFELAKIMKRKATLEDQEKQIRADLLEMMKADRKKIVNNSYLQITLKPASKRLRMDTAKLEKKYPDVFLDEEMWKTSEVKPYIIVKPNKGALLV